MSDVSTHDKQLTAERLKAFQEALEVLYIPGNMGGRLRFAEGWAPAAHYIFGAELSTFDREGTRDKERREQLEEEAEARRAHLVELVETLEDKSAERGVLQTEYVQNLITSLGRETALYLYAPWLVDRFAPGVPVVMAEEPAPKHETISQDPSSYDMAEAAISTELTKADNAPPIVERFGEEEEKEEGAPAEVPEIHPIDTTQPIVAAPVNTEEKPKTAPVRKTLKIFGIKDDASDKGGAGSSSPPSEG